MKISKNLSNPEIAELLRYVAASYELQNSAKNKFKIIAYERAADFVEHATSEIKDLWEEGQMDEVDGLGKSIQEHLSEIFKTGKSKHFEELMKDIPAVVFQLMKIPGIGVKTASKLVTQLKIKTIGDLKLAANEDKISSLEGFGQESQSKILKQIEEFEKKEPTRMLLPYAMEIAEEIKKWMLQDKSVKRIEPLGSLRRQVSTIGDIDFAVASEKPNDVLEHFTKYPKTGRIIEKGERTAAIVLPGNIRVDLMACKPGAYGALLQHFTGGKNHNVALREYSLKKDLSLSDYGIYTKPGDKSSLKEIATEEEFYEEYLKMDWIPPEIREDDGEIKAALEHKLPKLVELKDIKGDLHIHSNFDIETSHDLGSSSMEEIRKKAEEMGYEYIAFSEHNPSKSKHNEGQITDLLKRKREAVDKLNSKKGIKVFNSLEIDILPDGELPVSEEGLMTLDFCLVSIHSSFDLSRTQMTERILRAINNPKVKVFAHPTARLLNQRSSIDADWDKIMDEAIKLNIYMEINSDPSRLDLPDILVHEGVRKGVRFTIDTDTHYIDSLNNMKWGINVARRGWCEAEDIINSRNLKEFEKLML